ncbi:MULTISPECIES: RHS repeat-associated core domain-containing protein [Sorangium]|uniref:Conserved carbohydrate-binding protein, Rhs family n=1 Tax=Sorangium cellulosum (strain So ce56) TaxID=448385 RepID=A9FBU5_SORC5|nr:RHS repeat-associated core domain-containing protein [Sorangium cellulosum]CAN98052.1 conserved carbohydrate-binding protein, Rhs family [Sorangium cellulosum So ce56]
MARTAPVPNIPAIPGMNPGVFVMGGGGGGGGSGGRGGNGAGDGQGGNGSNGGDGAGGGGKGAGSCGTGSTDGGGCPNHHGSGSSGKMSRGDPVDVVTGRVFTVPAVDVCFPGPLPLVIERTYSSSARDRDVGLGFGWTHSLAWQLLQRRGSLHILSFDGVEHDLGKVLPGTGVIGPHGWIVHREGDGFRLDLVDGQYLFFGEQVLSDEGERYLPTVIGDRAQNRIVLAYDRGALAEVTDASGRIVRVLRGRDRRIAAFEAKNTVAQGRWVAFARYAYDAGGRLVEAADADGYVTRYEYDASHRLTSITGPTGLMFSFRYDDQGRCVETWGEYLGKADPSLTDDVPEMLADHVTRARGILHTKLEYSGDGYSEAVDSVALHRYFGNAHGLVDKAVTPLGVFGRTYDKRGFLASFTDPLGARTTWKRDAMGRETEVVDPLGRRTVIERDASGEITAVIGPDGETTRVDRAGDSLFWTDPIGAVCSARFDARGLPIEVRWPDGRTLVFRRDVQGNVIEHIDQAGAQTRARYDAWGRCVELWDARGGRTAFTYSTGGRVLSVISPDGSVERYEYDGAGNLISLTEPDGQTTRITYGGLHKPVRVERPNGEVTELKYNREGWLMRVTNGRGEVHSYERNLAGLVIAERTFDGRVLRYGYDAMGRVVWSENGLGQRSEYKRDLAGQMTRRIFDDGTEESFEYNGRGEIIFAENAAGRFAFDRNEKGWIVAETQEVAGAPVTVQTEYRITGEVAARRTSLGHTAQWSHDFARQQVALFLDGQAEAVSTRDPWGRELTRSLKGGARIDMAYDALGRLSERRIVSSTSGVRGRDLSVQPAWVGRLPPGTVHAEWRRYTPAGLLEEHWSARGGVTQYGYDPAGQLAGVRRHGGEVASFRYDLAGNLHDATPGAPPRSYAVGGRIQRAGDTEYTWDEDGRLVTKRIRRTAGEEELTRYLWSASGMLARVERPDGEIVAFEYDPFGRRVAKRLLARTADGSERLVEATRFVWDGGALVHEIRRKTDAGGDPIVDERTYVFEHDRTVPVAHREARAQGGARTVSAWWHYLTDDSGAPEMLVGPDGQIGCELARDPWGSATSAEGAQTSTPLRFRGQYADEETGLSYNRYRYYDPELGRYISADPLGIEGGLNVFAYAANCPTSAVDVEGLMYSIIKDRAGNIVADGHSQDTGRPLPASHSAVPNGKPCAERSALTNLAHRLGPGATKADVARMFQEEGYTLETYEGNADDYKRNRRVAANPCPVCKEMLKDMGIPHTSVQGHSPKNLTKTGPWNGESTYNPGTRKIFMNAGRR